MCGDKEIFGTIASIGVYAPFTTDVAVDVDDEERGEGLPERFELHQSYPNPFNPVTTIRYLVPSRTHVTIEIYNVLGQQVRTLVYEVKSVASYRIEWNGIDDAGKSVSTEVYLYRFKADDFVQTRKMTLLE